MTIAQFGRRQELILVQLRFFFLCEGTIVLKEILAQLPFRIEPMLFRAALGTPLHFKKVAGKNPDILAI